MLRFGCDMAMGPWVWISCKEIALFYDSKRVYDLFQKTVNKNFKYFKNYHSLEFWMTVNNSNVLLEFQWILFKLCTKSLQLNWNYIIQFDR